MAKDILGWVAIITGLGAAALWFRASVVKVRSEVHLRRLRKAGQLQPGEAPFQITEGPFDVLESIKASSGWNTWAAGVTAVSVLAQAAANFLAMTQTLT